MLISNVGVNCDIVSATDAAVEVDDVIATGKVFSDAGVNCVDVYAVDAPLTLLLVLSSKLL